MALNSRRARPFRLNRARAHGQRWHKALVAALAVAVSLVLAACGMNVQTNKPYIPADGINLDAGTVHIRNVLIFSRVAGTGYLSASLLTSDQDVLTGVSGFAIKADGSQGAALVAALPNPVAFGGGALVVLADRPPLIALTSADLKAGLDASLVLQFSKAGQVSVRVPVVDGNQAQYATITPSPAPASASPSS